MAKATLGVRHVCVVCVFVCGFFFLVRFTFSGFALCVFWYFYILQIIAHEFAITWDWLPFFYFKCDCFCDLVSIFVSFFFFGLSVGLHACNELKFLCTHIFCVSNGHRA